MGRNKRSVRRHRAGTLSPGNRGHCDSGCPHCRPPPDWCAADCLLQWIRGCAIRGPRWPSII